jgi:hypothetical protein
MDFIIPMPLLLVIDDVGWWSGCDGSSRNEPFRTGISRDHELKDYVAIIELGKKIGMRIQVGMVLCDWDQNNILRNVPTSTWMGSAWDNPYFPGTGALDSVSALLKDNSGFIELCLHALGHEYWDGGVMSRAEWADMDGEMRPESEIEAHISAFGQIMEQNRLGDFPVSYIPAAFRHSFGDADGIAARLKNHGIKFISTPFSCMRRAEETENELFGIDHGIPTVDRGDNNISWRDIAPSLEDKVFDGPICGIHWPNILHQNPDRNIETVEHWAEVLDGYDKRFERVLARDAFDCWTQLVHHALTDISCDGAALTFDFSRFEELNPPFVNETFRVKIKTDREINPDEDIIEDRQGFCYTLKIAQKEKQLKIKI